MICCCGETCNSKKFVPIFRHVWNLGPAFTVSPLMGSPTKKTQNTRFSISYMNADQQTVNHEQKHFPNMVWSAALLGLVWEFKSHTVSNMLVGRAMHCYAFRRLYLCPCKFGHTQKTYWQRVVIEKECNAPWQWPQTIEHTNIINVTPTSLSTRINGILSVPSLGTPHLLKWCACKANNGRYALPSLMLR